MLSPTASRARVFPEGLEACIAARAHHGRQAENEPGHHRQYRGDEQHARIDAWRFRNRQVIRHEARQKRQRRDRDADAKRAADARQYQAFGHQVAHEALATSAHRRPHGKLASTFHRPREQEVRKVGAGNQQHTRRGAGERHEQQTRAGRDVVAQRVRGGAGSCDLAVLLRGASRQHRPFRPHIFDREAFAQTADRIQPVVVPILVVALIEPHRRPERDVAGREEEVGRHDADDRVRGVVEIERLPDDAPVAREVILPEAITEHDRARRAAAVVGGGEGPSNDGSNAKRRKEIGGHGGAFEPRRLAFADHVHGEPVVRADRFERVAGAFPVTIVRRRQLHPVKSRLGLPERHQAIGLVKRQRAKQDEIRDRKRGSCRPDAKRHDENGCHGKARRPCQRSSRVPEIVSQDVPMHRGGVSDQLDNRLQPEHGVGKEAGGFV